MGRGGGAAEPAPSMLSIGSLFSGIGGLDLGLEQAGLGPVLWQVEINPFCRAVLRKHWPKALRYEDIRTTDPRALSRVSVLCGGFPCQDLSVAGKGRGLAGERSGLWSEFRRFVAALRPPWAVVENVAHGRGRWLPTVQSDLEDLGYGSVAYQVSAADVGAPHRRERIFVVASDPERQQVRQFAEWLPARWPRSLPGQGQALALGNGEAWAPAEPPAWPAPPTLCGMDDGLTHRVDRHRALGNAVVPHCARLVGEIIRRAAGELPEDRPMKTRLGRRRA